MIPRLKPCFGKEELYALFSLSGASVSDFEKEFAKTLRVKYAVAFNYGRSALYTILKSAEIQNKEVILPAYTCVVVANAIVLSGNIPRFIDICPDNFTMDLELLKKAINSNTGAVIATHLFGYPMNTDKIREIVKSSGKNILLVQDCAQSFGNSFNGSLVCNQGDIALYSLRWSKIICTVLGAIVTTNNDEIYEKTIKFRDQHFYNPGIFSRLRHFIYVLSTYGIFNNKTYGYINFLEDLHLIDHFTISYDRKVINFPSDAMELLTDSAARIGMVQLKKYNFIIQKRRFIADYYNKHLSGVEGLILPESAEGATWSYYSPRVKNKKDIISKMRKRGII